MAASYNRDVRVVCSLRGANWIFMHNTD